jgi:hypothetical protein
MLLDKAAGLLGLEEVVVVVVLVVLPIQDLPQLSVVLNSCLMPLPIIQPDMLPQAERLVALISTSLVVVVAQQETRFLVAM